jgi:hypothetical protein
MSAFQLRTASLTHTADERWQYYPVQAAAITGYSRDEVLGRDLVQVCSTRYISLHIMNNSKRCKAQRFKDTTPSGSVH